MNLPHDLAHVLDQFEATLKNQVAQLQAAAKSAAPGGVGDWEGVVHHFGLPGLERPDRIKEAGRRAHPRGAFPDEFEAVVGVLARQAGEVLGQIRQWHQPAVAANPELGARLASLDTFVRDLPGHQRQAYADALKPKTGVAGLAGIFANASATAKLTPWADLQYDTHLTLACPSCGSPQRTRLRFDCEYCGSSMFGPDETRAPK